MCITAKNIRFVTKEGQVRNKYRPNSRLVKEAPLLLLRSRNRRLLLVIIEVATMEVAATQVITKAISNREKK